MIPRQYTNLSVVGQLSIDACQQATDGMGITGIVAIAVRLAPGAECLEPGVTVSGSITYFVAQTLTYCVSNIAAVFEQQSINCRIDFT
ncbi:hypothetical protein D9M71_765940 [compost metagenome]